MTRKPLPGLDTTQTTQRPVVRDSVAVGAVRVGYRAFDRQWIIPDARLMDMPRRDLWAARRPGQVFTIEQHSKAIDGGPGVVFSALIPDFHHFDNRGGRVLPLLHPDGSQNIAPGLLGALSARLNREVAEADMLAYVAGVAGHPGFTRTFADELTTPGIRVPLTSDAVLFEEAVELGEQVIWLHTYGETCTGTGRPAGGIRYPRGDERQPQALTPITTMPTGATYDADRAVVTLGDGEFGPVRKEVWDYVVGSKNVIKSWTNYRKAEPGGKKSSPLDHIHVEEWDPDWTTEFIDLLTVLTRLVELEPAQAGLLERILATGAHPGWTATGQRAASFPGSALADDGRRPQAALR